jgi:23S rRNA-/tRNA-specific pseudouridylate synthase
MAVGAEGKGKKSTTSITVLKRGTLALQGHPRYGEPVALLLLKPVTGRRHQLRVHCLHLGHPMVRDNESAITYNMRFSDTSDTVVQHIMQAVITRSKQ